MKRTISFVVALVMCCSLLLPALPAANAMVMDFIWGEPGQTAPERKVSFEILEQMARAEDDELLRVHVHLRGLPEETIEALVPMTKPSFNVNESTQEEMDAWSRAFSETRSRLNRSIVEGFIQRYFDETDPRPSVSGYYSPEFILSANKADGSQPSSEDMQIATEIVQSRVNALGASETTVQQQGTNSILVQIPGATDAEAAFPSV